MLKKNCPKCDATQQYKSIPSYKKAVNLNTVCKPCSQILYPRVRTEQGRKNIVESNRTRKNKPRSEDSRKRTSKGITTSSKWQSHIERVQTDEYRNNMRQIKNDLYENNPELRQRLRVAMIKQRQMLYGENKFAPNYNKKACQYFDWLNMYMGWEGQHAENGGEHHIKELGYFVDYYEPTLNLIIEWDEKYHNNSKQKKKDVIRQNRIMDFLGCEFYRVNVGVLDVR